MFSQGSKFRFSLSILLLAALCQSQLQAGLASPLPGTGAPIAAAHRLSPDGDPTIPFSYPMLRDVVKSLAQNGFPLSSFLNLTAGELPGIDLRPMLLYEVGILKSPVKFSARKKKQDFPVLSANSIPESSGEMPSGGLKLAPAATMESEPGAGKTPGGLAPGQKKQEKKEGPSLSIDLPGFSVELPGAAGAAAAAKVNPEDSDTIAMIPPVAVELQPANPQESSFRFWTVPQVLSSPENKIDARNPYSGSFVMMSPKGLKAVEGRLFFLNEGHMLASASEIPIVVDTPVARVSVEAAATAYVEVEKPGLTRVRVLEAKPQEYGVSVKYNSDGKACEVHLQAGDDFLIADHKLGEAEKSEQAKAQSGTEGGSNWNKSKFLPAQLVENDKFFSDRMPLQNPEQRSAIAALRKRIK